MSTNTNLLKEAIADAKAVKNMAIENAKLTLQEAFTPQLKSILTAKLQEMENDEDEMAEEDLNLESILKEMDTAEFDNDEENETEDEEKSEDENETEETEDDAETLDLENMTDDDLTKLIADTVSAMVSDGELELNGSDETEDETEDEAETEEVEETLDESTEEEGEEIDLDALLAEIDALDENDEIENDLDEGVGSFFKGIINKIKGSVTGFDEFSKTEPYTTFINKYKSDEGGIDQEKVASAGDQYKNDVNRLGAIYQQWAIKTHDLDPSVARNDMNDLKASLGSAVKRGKTTTEFPEIAETEMSEELYETKKKLNEALNVIDIQSTELKVNNLLNAKLLYVNRIFKAKNLSESQKLTVIGTFDKASNVSEVKLVYETMKGSLNSKTKRTISENRGSASKAIATTKSSKPIIEVENAFTRMNEIAFFKSKH